MTGQSGGAAWKRREPLELGSGDIRDRGAEMWDRQTVDTQRAVLSPAEGQPRAPHAPCVLVPRGLR